LWKRLVLDVKAGHPAALESARRLPRRERVAVSGVGVGDDGKIDGVDDLLEPGSDFVRRHQAEVRNSGAACDGSAAGIYRGKSGQRDEPGREPVIDAGSDDRRPGLKKLPKLSCLAHQFSSVLQPTKSKCCGYISDANAASRALRAAAI